MNKQEFLNIIRQQTGLSEPDAQRVSRAVLLTLRSQLSPIEVADVDETLPVDIDNFWHGGWLQMLVSRLQSLRELDKDEFIEQVRETSDLQTKQEAENLIRIVFHALKEAIPEQEVDHINHDLPNDLLDLWKAA